MVLVCFLLPSLKMLVFFWRNVGLCFSKPGAGAGVMKGESKGSMFLVYLTAGEIVECISKRICTISRLQFLQISFLFNGNVCFTFANC